jgi:hypothetical protein
MPAAATISETDGIAGADLSISPSVIARMRSTSSAAVRRWLSRRRSVARAARSPGAGRPDRDISFFIESNPILF